LHFTNSDFVWSNDFPLVRFGQGAFKNAFLSTFKQLTGILTGRYGNNVGHVPTYTQYGKPERITYDYAKQVLEAYAKKIHGKCELKCFAVGDNPDAGII
jgi:ribonucleotide monophosphatase NagD (HAD superfamily)